MPALFLYAHEVVYIAEVAAMLILMIGAIYA